MEVGGVSEFDYRPPDRPFPEEVLDRQPMEVSRSVLGALLEDRGESRDNEFALRWFKQYMHRVLEENEFLRRGIRVYRKVRHGSSCGCWDCRVAIASWENEAEAREREARDVAPTNDRRGESHANG